MYVPQLPYPFVCWWTSKLLPSPGYYKQCCDEHWGIHVCFNSGFLDVYAQQWDFWVTWQFYFQFFLLWNNCLCLPSPFKALEKMLPLRRFSKGRAGDGSSEVMGIDHPSCQSRKPWLDHDPSIYGATSCPKYWAFGQRCIRHAHCLLDWITSCIWAV